MKTKYIHLYHPKKTHTHTKQTVKIVHARQDPNVQFVKQLNPGFQPAHFAAGILEQKPVLSEYDLTRWREMGLMKAYGIQNQGSHVISTPVDEDYDEGKSSEDEEDEDDDEDNDRYMIRPSSSSYSSSHKSNHKSSSKNSSSNKPKKNEGKKRDNFRSSKGSGKRHKASMSSSQNRPMVSKAPGTLHTDSRGPYNDINVGPNLGEYSKNPNFGFAPSYAGERQMDSYNEESIHHDKFFSVDPKAVDPGFYSTLPDDKEMEQMTGMEDDIYSGLMTHKFGAQVGDKTKKLRDINNSRKQKTKKLVRVVRS